jgi:hypothetical protein
VTAEERVSLERAKVGTEKKMLDDIRAFGLHWLSIFDPENSERVFCYSVGLWHTHNHPEVIIFGLDRTLSGQILNGINRDISDGKSFEAGLSSMDCLEGFRCYFETFPKEQYRDHLGMARWFYGGDHFPAVQMLWPTTSGIFPWQANASEPFKKMQPVFSNLPLSVC